jgi:hypothetical protein
MEIILGKSNSVTDGEKLLPLPMPLAVARKFQRKIAKH